MAVLDDSRRVLGVDLACRSWDEIGSALVEFGDGGFRDAVPGVMAWPPEELTPAAVARCIDVFARASRGRGRLHRWPAGMARSDDTVQSPGCRQSVRVRGPHTGKDRNPWVGLSLDVPSVDSIQPLPAHTARLILVQDSPLSNKDRIASVPMRSKSSGTRI